MMDKLLPCPFCGGIGTLWSIDQCDTVYAVCQDCGARTVDYKHAEEAIAAWNSRTGKDINVATNADRIRSMSDEELAEYIFDLGNGSEYCYGHCAYQDDCATKGLDHDTCIKGVIDWLQQPAKEEKHEAD